MSNNAASNVISMRDFDRSDSDRNVTDRAGGSQHAAQFERLLQECHDLSAGRLQASLSGMLDKFDDAVTALYNATTDREVRDVYLKAKDRAHEQRKVIEEQFRNRYRAESETRASPHKKPKEDFSQYDLSSLELGLVGDDDLEETLKINDMAAKLRRYCEEELAALDQRVGVLIGDATLQGERNPFSPQAICNAFKQACRHVEPDLKIRMVFHKMFDDHVLDDIRSIYKDLNALLIERSILPKIRYGIARNGGRGGAALPAAVAQAVSAATGALRDADDGYAGGGGADQDFFSVLQGLMALNVGVRGVAPGVPGGGGAVPAIPGFPPILAGGAPLPGAAQLQGPELLGSLTRIQHGDISSIGGGNLPLAASLVEPGTKNVLRELKGTTLGNGMAQMDVMTLDIVSMLFDQIFDDEKIPVAMKGLMGRLQIPMLKVALLDKTFFSKKAHPARKLLDSLGEVGMQLPADFSPASTLYKPLETVTQKLIDGFQESMEIFDELRGELDHVIGEENRRAEAEARRVAQAIEQKERLEVAKAVAQHAIRLRAKSRKIPPVVLKFLSQQWVKLLLVAYAKHGADSDAYKTALSTMDLLIWSVTPMQTLEERRSLAGRLPGLLKRLNFGMQLVSTDEATKKAFFAKLMRCHTRIINGQSAPERKIANSGSASATPAPMAAPVAAAPAPAAAPPVLTDAVSDLDFTASGSGPRPETAPTPSVPATPATAAPAASAEPDEEMEPTEATPDFAAVKVPNPFGEGEIEVEEISLSDIPGAPGVGPVERESSPGDDEATRAAKGLKEGAWVEFSDDQGNRQPGRLSYISPLKGTYLFVNRHGRRMGEYSVQQLAAQLRQGRAVQLDEVPLFDRAMTSLVGVLKGGGKLH